MIVTEAISRRDGPEAVATGGDEDRPARFVAQTWPVAVQRLGIYKKPDLGFGRRSTIARPRYASAFAEASTHLIMRQAGRYPERSDETTSDPR
jgi:hypothetical protein